MHWQNKGMAATAKSSFSIIPEIFLPRKHRIEKKEGRKEVNGHFNSLPTIEGEGTLGAARPQTCARAVTALDPQ